MIRLSLNCLRRQGELLTPAFFGGRGEAAFFGGAGRGADEYFTKSRSFIWSPAWVSKT